MPIPLRPDFDAAGVRQAARASKDANQVRRLLALAAIYDGASRSEAAGIGGVTLQIVRDWVLKFNAHGPGGLIDRKAPGQPSRLDGTHRSALAAMLENGPIPAVHGVVHLHLAAISAEIAPGRHAALLLDQAGWHVSARLNVPDNITIVPLPAKCPELNPQETSGSSCATTGSPIGCSPATITLSITAAAPGTNSPISHGSSCRSDCETGRIGTDQRVLV